MINKIRVILLFLLGAYYPINTFSQAPTAPYLPGSVVNYIRLWEPSVKLSTPAAVTTANNVSSVKLTTSYFDGLGRKLQIVKNRFSPLGKDLVEPILYDEQGNEKYKYLMYISTGNDGAFKLNPFAEQQNFLSTIFPGETNFFAQTNFEPSPLKRVQKKLLPGQSWVGTNRGQSKEYAFNSEADNIVIWRIPKGEGQLPVWVSRYQPNTLSKEVTINEHGIRSIEFKDVFNRTILKKTELTKNAADGNNGWLCTYFLYDEYGRLRIVLPPKAIEQIKSNWMLTEDILNGLCFQYYYDGLDRLISKKLPGVDKTEMVYDARDRLVYERDASTSGRWKVTFYDEFNRPTRRGLYTTTKTRTELQEEVNAISESILSKKGDLIVSSRDYTISTYQASSSITFQPGFEATLGESFTAVIDPNAVDGNIIRDGSIVNPVPTESNVEFLSYTYYNTYTFSGSTPFNTADFSKLVNNDSNIGEAVSSASNKTIGLETGNSVKILGTNQWISTTNYYDQYGHIIQIIGNNSVGGVNSKSTRYDFNGRIISNYLRHSNNLDIAVPEIGILSMVNYDVVGRVLNVKKKLVGESTYRTLVANKYNELGKLQEQTLGSLTTNKFEYNPNGFIIGMNRDYVKTGTGAYFGYEMIYDKATSSLFPGTNIKAPQFDGSVSAVIWRGTGQPRRYDYSYDNSSRLLAADYSVYNGGWARTSEDFSVKLGDGLDPVKAYDANGNILSLVQNATTGGVPLTLDNLNYSYFDNSNKLKFVYDMNNNPVSTLGDFKEPAQNNTLNRNSGAVDYLYDGNGNMQSDANKGISNIIYNHFNLPESVTFSDNSQIKFQYDAEGGKIKKTVIDNSVVPVKTTTINYDNAIEYVDNKIKSVGHEEGRIRVIQNSGQPVTFAFDYFIKDYLGNIRSVITDNNNANKTYLATMESGRSQTESALFSNIEQSRVEKPIGYPDGGEVSNKFVARLNGLTKEKRIGPSLVLRVMKGDTVQISTTAFYKSGAAEKKQGNVLNEVANATLTVLSGDPRPNNLHGQSEVAARTWEINGISSESLKKTSPGNDDPELRERPKAYLNYVLFDDGAKMVDNNSGVKRLREEPDQVQQLGTDKIVMETSGFLYVFESNEGANDVYFDNLSIVLGPGPLVEEYHYYPFGLRIDAISSAAYPSSAYYQNMARFNGKALNTKELKDGRGLEFHDFGARLYDAQIGRWQSMDPLAGKFAGNTPYSFAVNNPVKFIDPNGKAPAPPSTFIDEYGNVIGGSITDGDKGVYMVKGLTTSNFKVGSIDTYKNEGMRIGETVSIRSFLSPENGNWMGKVHGTFNAKASFDRAVQSLQKYMVTHYNYETFLYYKSNAGNGQIYDLKMNGFDRTSTEAGAQTNYVYQASFFMPGFIMTRRDVGNYFAGTAARMFGLSEIAMLSGFGAYQANGNQQGFKFLGMAILNYIDQFIMDKTINNSPFLNGSPNGNTTPLFHDDPASEELQRAGYETE
jgi:RHS repeat-associated protein